MRPCMVLYSSGWGDPISEYARVVELVDSLDSGSGAHSGHAGSSPASRTKQKERLLPLFFVCGEVVGLNPP